MAGDRACAKQYLQLERQLLLLSWLNGHLGYTGNQELFEDLKQADEGFCESGQSHLLLHFQHLAVLYAEIFLDARRAGQRGRLLDSLNSHVLEHNAQNTPVNRFTKSFAIAA